MTNRHPPVTQVNYQFLEAGLTPRLMSLHADYVRKGLCMMFALDVSRINVSSKPRLPCDAPFLLTAYTGESTTSPVAMVLAAKAVLPNYRALQEMARDWQAWIDAWDPKKCGIENEWALRRIAAGQFLHLGERHRAYLAEAAFEVGINPDEEGLCDSDLAHEILQRHITSLILPVVGEEY